MKINRRPPPAPHIPFISLADIAWQIIIFFFMAASFTKLDAMKVAPPSATTDAKSQQQEKTTTVVVKTDALSIDGTSITMDELGLKLADRLDKLKKEDRVVIVEGSKGLTHERNVEVMYRIQKAGGTPMMSAPESDDAKAAH